MIITKYPHSCVLIESDGKKLLIDPGMFSFTDQFKPSDIGSVDVVLVTHSHPDHYYPDALKHFAAHAATVIISHQELVTIMQADGISAESMSDGETKQIANFTIKALKAKHGDMPLGIPDNFAFIINDKILHPGDSYEITDTNADILLLPIVAPWTRLVDTVAYAQSLKPKHVIPIHEMIYREGMGERMAEMVKEKLAESNIPLSFLKPGETLNTDTI